MVFAAAGCSLVDEDLSVCPEKYELEYEMQLVTNVSTEISTELNLETDVYVANALRTHLGGVFSDYAHDVNLSFYDVAEPKTLLENIRENMDASQTSYSLHLPIRDYIHLAVANIAQNTIVSLQGEEFCSTSCLFQSPADSETGIVDSHDTGIFTARVPMNIVAGVSQQFHVNLYMANCASALVLDKSLTPEIRSIAAYSTGFAESFNIADSTYVFGSDFLVKSVEVPMDEGNKVCYVTVQFPSRDALETPAEIQTKSIIESESNPDSESLQDGVLWEWQIYVTMPDGTITCSRLGLLKPLRAGQLEIVRCRLLPDGSIEPADLTVAASVTLDWNSGGSHEIQL
jgi:hypothetical protein